MQVLVRTKLALPLHMQLDRFKSPRVTTKLDESIRSFTIPKTQHKPRMEMVVVLDSRRWISCSDRCAAPRMSNKLRILSKTQFSTRPGAPQSLARSPGHFRIAPTKCTLRSSKGDTEPMHASWVSTSGAMELALTSTMSMHIYDLRVNEAQMMFSVSDLPICTCIRRIWTSGYRCSFLFFIFGFGHCIDCTDSTVGNLCP